MSDMSFLVLLAARVKEAREQLQLNQEQAAERAGIGIASWRRVEQRQQVRSGTLRAMAKALHLAPEELIGLANGAAPPSAPRTAWEEETSRPESSSGEVHGSAHSAEKEGSERQAFSPAIGRAQANVLAETRLAPGIADAMAEVGSSWQAKASFAPEDFAAETVTLEPALQRLYARLSVIENLVPLEAVAQICGEPNAEEYLERLREHGLIRVETVHGKECVRVLPRQEAETLARAHAGYFCNMALQVTAQKFRPGEPSNEEQLRAFYPDLQRALEWYLAQGDAETTLRFVVALTAKPLEGSTVPQMQQWLARALARPGAETSALWRARAQMELANLSDFHRAEPLYKECFKLFKRLGEEKEAANALRRLAVLKRREGNFKMARKLFEQSLAASEANRDKLGIAAVCNSFANLECQEQNYATARALYERARTSYYEEGDGDRLAGVLENLGTLAFQAQQYARARDYYERSFALRENLGLTSNYADSLYNIGDVAMHQGDYREAEDCFRKALRRCQAVGGHQAAELLEGYAALKLKRVQPVCAARLFGAAMGLRESVHNPPPASERLGYALDVKAARAALDKDVFEAEWQAGRKMSLQEALQYALDTPDIERL